LNLSLNNKKVLITGSSRGIGLAISEVFLQEGAKTYLVSRGSDDLYENEKRLQDIYGLEHVFASKCDCTNIESLNNLKLQVEDKWKELDNKYLRWSWELMLVGSGVVPKKKQSSRIVIN